MKHYMLGFGNILKRIEMRKNLMSFAKNLLKPKML